MKLSWMNDLYETYECNLGEVAEKKENSTVLLPVAHSTQNAQIEIVLNEEGEFLSANKVDKENAVTIIPVTEDSAARSSGVSAHPLEDKLEYIAKDYEQYTGVDNSEKFKAYESQLGEWADSKDALPCVRAIYTYVQSGTMMKDLVMTKVLEVEGGSLTKAKIEGIDQKDAFVRFSVQEQSQMAMGKESRIYLNKDLFKCYTNYYVGKQNEIDLCYASGREIPCSRKHPAKIRNAGDKAKLISANDTSGFTFRGRFSESSQVASIGYETSQKAHNALRWLVGKQGFSIGELSIVAWEITGKPVVSLFKDTDEAFEFEDETFGDEEDVLPFTNEQYAKRLELACKGYKQKLDANSRIVVLGMEAATTGRLSISFYKKMMGSDFMDRVLFWHNTCFWKHFYKKDKKGNLGFVGAPSPKDIAAAAFGDKNEKLTKATIERILPCIIDKRKIPKDLVKAAVNRVSNPNSFENSYKKAVSITCALVRKKRFDYEGEEWEMALDRTCRDRSYVFGRLLGAAQKLEEEALRLSNEQARGTSAERFMQQFTRRPGKTWKIINDCLRPYVAKLRAVNKTYCIIELQKIYDLIDEKEFASQEPLSEVYLLGYNCQLNSYYQNNNENTNSDEKGNK